MIKLRYKFYIILFIIFLITSISFTALIIFTTNYNRDNVKNAYYNVLFNTSRQSIKTYTECICKSILYNNSLSKSNDNYEYIINLLKEFESDNPDIEIYLQSIVSYNENDISIYNLYSSKYKETQNTFNYYDKNTEIKKHFYPSYKTLTELEKNKIITETELIYNTNSLVSEKRTFYSHLIPDLNLIITCCFYDNNLKEQSENYALGLTDKNKGIISIVLTIIIFLIITLFLFLCYIESIYYKKLETKYLSEKLKTDEKYKELQRMAQTDALTKCYNRKYLNESMSTVFTNFLGGHLSSSVILFDIDNFKKINDTYGHSAGDAVLVQISETVRKIIRREDILARWGGEEFVVFFKYTNITSALLIAEKLRAAIEDLTITSSSHKIKVTASIGISSFKKSDSTPEDCIERADDAMYISKKTGKNKVTLYNK